MNNATSFVASMPTGNINQSLMHGPIAKAQAQTMQNAALSVLKDGFTITKDIMKMLGVKEENVKSHIKQLPNMTANNLQLPFQQTNYATTFMLGRNSVDSIMPTRMSYTSANDVINAALSHEIALNVQPINGDTYEVTSFGLDTSYFWFTTYFEKDAAISFNAQDLANKVRNFGIPDIFGNTLQTMNGQVDEYRLEYIIRDAIELLLSASLGSIFMISEDNIYNRLLSPLDMYQDNTMNYGQFKDTLRQHFNIKNDVDSFSGMVSIGNFSEIAKSQKTYEMVLQSVNNTMRDMEKIAFQKYGKNNTLIDKFEIENIKKFYLIGMCNYMLSLFLVTIFKLEVSNHYQALNMILNGSNINLMNQDSLNLAPQFNELDQKRVAGSKKLAEKGFDMVFDKGYCGGHIDYTDPNNNSVVKVDTVFFANGSSVSQGPTGGALENPTMEAFFKRFQVQQNTLLRKDGLFNAGLSMTGLSMDNPKVLSMNQSVAKFLLQDIKANSPYFNNPNMLYNISGLDGAYLNSLQYLNPFASGVYFENGLAVGTILEPVFPITLNKQLNANDVSEPQNMITYFVKLCVIADREYNNVCNPLLSKNPDAKKIICTDRDLNNGNRSTSMFQHSTKFVGGKYRSAVDNIDPVYNAIKVEVNTLLDNAIGGRPNVVHVTDISYLAHNHTFLKDENGYTIALFQQVLDQFKQGGRIRPIHDLTIDMLIANNSQLVKDFVNPLETRHEFVLPSFTDTTGGYIPTTVAIPN